MTITIRDSIGASLVESVSGFICNPGSVSVYFLDGSSATYSGVIASAVVEEE